MLAAQQLPLSQGDPADRFMGATTQLTSLMLVVSDDNLVGCGIIATIKNLDESFWSAALDNRESALTLESSICAKVQVAQSRYPAGLY